MNIEQRIQYLSKIGYEVTEDDIVKNQKKSVVVGMSGGVDSSVCAVICKLLGYKTTGMFMKNWEEIDESGECPAEEDYKDVVSVCEELDLPYYTINFSEEYKERVFAEFLEEYKKGNTPNPDILCNREIKFKVFYDKVMKFGADYLATGHYCQKEYKNGEFLLKKGKDGNKDQSYFLYAIDGKVLKNILFPIGHIEKSLVRKIAKDFNLITQKKKDSTGICFIGEKNFKKFLGDYIDGQKGMFINLENSKEIMPHDGTCFYTIGQRKGLGIGGPGGPWFVAGKDNDKNEVYVVEGEKHPALYSYELEAEECTWITSKPNFPLKCMAKVRYRQSDQECEISVSGNKLKVSFKTPQRAIALRQSVVFYSKDVCLGGGIITKRGESLYESKLK